MLIVDDDGALRDIYASALAAYGHEVRTAADGAEALRHLEEGWDPCVAVRTSWP